MTTALDDLIAGRAPVILDGGLGTELESRGFTLDVDPLWSAALILDAPAALREVHESYFRAGAECATTATYQAFFAGFARRGLDESDAAAVFVRAVGIAREAQQRTGAARAFVAGSLGSFGACLADGSEFHGNYELSREALADFHRPRIRALAAGAPDVLAFETIPKLEEAIAIGRLLDDENPSLRAWISFSCRDERSISHGEDIAEAVRVAGGYRGVVALGINCTSPDLIEPLLHRARAATDKPLLVYPNSGETWSGRRWTGPQSDGDLVDLARRWLAAGAGAIGGCCRTTPADVSRLAEALIE